MTEFTIASFNVKNLIGPDSEYYPFQSYTPEEFAWKKDWMADQLLSMDADIVGFQEIFEEDALRAVITETTARTEALNAGQTPQQSGRHHRKAIFRDGTAASYDEAALAFAANAGDTGTPGQRRPGLAILSRLGFAGPPEIIQDLPTPLHIPFTPLAGPSDDPDAGHFTLRRLSRPILKVRVPVGDRTVTVFNCHLKSKRGEYIPPPDAAFAPEEDLTRYDPIGRAIGDLRAALRRMAEAVVLRAEIVAELEAGHPVLALGDFNDVEEAVSTRIVSGEAPSRNYAWMLRHDATTPHEHYTDAEHSRISQDIAAQHLQSAERLVRRKSLRDMVYTTSFGGVFNSIDQIFLSRHFHPENPDRLGEMTHFSAFNDHLADGSFPEAPYNKLVSDHGQIMAHIRLGRSQPSAPV